MSDFLNCVNRAVLAGRKRGKWYAGPIDLEVFQCQKARSDEGSWSAGKHRADGASPQRCLQDHGRRRGGTRSIAGRRIQTGCFCRRQNRSSEVRRSGGDSADGRHWLNRYNEVMVSRKQTSEERWFPARQSPVEHRWELFPRLDTRTRPGVMPARDHCSRRRNAAAES